MNQSEWLEQVTVPYWLVQANAGTLVPKTRLLVLQSTPYCNINCSYCYLSHRDVRATMSIDTVRATMRAIRADGLNHSGLTIVFHAGEPLVLSANYYRGVFSAIMDEQIPEAPNTFGLQTNAISLTKDHCKLFREYNVKMGVSLDGPESLHDANRRTRNNRGTHALTLRGLQLLQDYGLNPSLICVVTKSTLRHARELVRFFHSLGVMRISLNFEEIEGCNLTTSVQGEDLGDLETFLRDVYLASKDMGICVREFIELDAFNSEDSVPDQQVTPFAIVSVDWQGNFSTFSPELLDQTHDKYGHFRFGNVHDGSIVSAEHDPKFVAVYSDIREGVTQCRAECDSFNICGGGAPSNKLAERGTFAATETLSCRIRKKTVARVYFEETTPCADEQSRAKDMRMEGLGNEHYFAAPASLRPAAADDSSSRKV